MLDSNGFFRFFVLVLCAIGYSKGALASPAWSIDCGKVKSQCIAHQLIRKTGNLQQIVLGVMISHAKSHPAPHIIFRTSPKADIEKGVAVKVDNNPILTIPISGCDARVCEVRSFIPKGLMVQMLSGQRMHFAFFIEDKQYTYPISLQGFGDMISKIHSSS